MSDSAGPEPLISVVIPTFNKQPSLAAVLEALHWQELAPERFEVAVVVDGATDGTLAYLEGFRPRYRLRYHVRPNGGRSAARNFGAARTRGQHVLFVDDDVLLHPAHLARLAESVLRAPQAVHVGHLSNVPIAQAQGVMETVTRSHSVDFEWLRELCGTSTLYEGIRVLFSGEPLPSGAELRPAVWWALVTGGNVCVPRDVFERVGGFDERFREWGPEEADLCYRLFRLGVEARYNGLCRLFHLDHGRDRDRLCSTLLQHAKQLYVKHGRRPELLQFLRYYNGLCSLEDFNNGCADAYGLPRLKLERLHAVMGETTGRKWVVRYDTGGESAAGAL